MKGGDETCLPLSIEMHDQLDGRKLLPNGEMGNKRMEDGRYRFEHFYRISLAAFVRGFNARWFELTGKVAGEKSNGNVDGSSGAAAA